MLKERETTKRKTVVTGEMGWKILQRCPSFKLKGSNVGETERLNVVYSPLCEDNEVLVLHDKQFRDEVFQGFWDSSEY